MFYPKLPYPSNISSPLQRRSFPEGSSISNKVTAVDILAKGYNEDHRSRTISAKFLSVFDQILGELQMHGTVAPMVWVLCSFLTV